jgi:hypothetical protein
MPRRITTEEFIERAKARHGERYDYSEVRYVKIRERVTIRCRVHGLFDQTPHEHMNGAGCARCGADSSGRASSLRMETRYRSERSDRAKRDLLDLPRTAASWIPNGIL